MANLGTFELNPTEDYIDLSEATGISFISGKTYILQIYGDIILCENDTKPTKKFDGKRIIDDERDFDCDGTTLWYKTFRNTEKVLINISD